MSKVTKAIILYSNSHIFNISRFLGIFADGGTSRNVLFANVISKVLLFGLLLFNVCMILRTIFLQVFAVMDLVWKAYALISLLCTILLYHRQFKVFSDSEIIFRPAGYGRVRSHFSAAMCFYLFTLAVKLFAFSSIMYFTRRDNIISYVLFTSYIVLTLTEFGFCLIVSQMYLVGSAIATHIATITRCISEDPYSIYDKCSRLMESVDMAVALNRFYQRQILYGYFYSFIKLINCGYYTAMFVLVRGHLFFRSGYYKANFILNVAVVCGAFVPIVLPLAACERINYAVNSFYEELFKIVKDSDELCKNKKVCLYLTLRQSSVNFSACGFFNLGYPLVTSIIAAATTYLVILIQFSSDDPD